MKEEDLNKHLDNILIDGLIKEAEQDNADFEAAMRNLSDSAFNDIINEEPPVTEDSDSSDITEERACVKSDVEPRSCQLVFNSNTGNFDYDLDFFEELGRYGFASSEPKPSSKQPSRRKVFRPWIVSVATAAVVILAVLIPSLNFMNGRLCDSALYMSQDYITAHSINLQPQTDDQSHTRPQYMTAPVLDLSTATDEQIKEALPSLEDRYEEFVRSGDYGQAEFQEAAWDLAVAYLKLHKRSDAVRVLKTLASQRQGTPIGDHCRKLLEQLD